jgi:hypothetical protein
MISILRKWAWIVMFIVLVAIAIAPTFISAQWGQSWLIAISIFVWMPFWLSIIIKFIEVTDDGEE